MKTIIPSIDISHSKCVRLVQGKKEDITHYPHDPVHTAALFVEYGATRIHVVDIDAAFCEGNNRAIIGEICREIESSALIEVGGGIRSEHDVRQLVDLGVQRLSVGSSLVNNFFDVQHWIHAYGTIFSAALDARDNKIQISGWLKDSNIDILTLLEQLAVLDITCINYTNINVEGKMEGPDIKSTNQVATHAHVPVVLAGGVGDESHVHAVMNEASDNVFGIIIGKAIYENTIDIKKLLQQYPPAPSDTW